MVANKENTLVLTTPKRNEILKDGAPEVKFNRCQILGRGAYGTVFKAIYRGIVAMEFRLACLKLNSTENSVALKIIKNTALSTLHNEAHILNWKHKNIVRLIKLEATPEFGLLIMERPNGLCLQRIVDTLSLPLMHRVLITLDILAALRYCISQNVLHLDVKPTNVLVALGTIPKSVGKLCPYKRSYICKLCDFGSSIKLDEHCAESSAKGTLRYMSPEALRSAPLSCASDIYSLGITMWQMQARCLPFYTLTCNETIAYQVVKHELRPDNYALLEALKLGSNQPEKVTLSSSECAEHVDSSIKYNSEDLFYGYSSKINPQLQVILSGELFKRTNVLARRNLNFETTHGRVHKRQKQRKQPRLAHCFANLSPVSVTCLESVYSDLYKSCWVSQPELRLSNFQLQKRLELILLKCLPAE